MSEEGLEREADGEEEEETHVAVDERLHEELLALAPVDEEVLQRGEERVRLGLEEGEVEKEKEGRAHLGQERRDDHATAVVHVCCGARETGSGSRSCETSR